MWDFGFLLSSLANWSVMWDDGTIWKIRFEARDIRANWQSCNYVASDTWQYRWNITILVLKRDVTPSQLNSRRTSMTGASANAIALGFSKRRWMNEASTPVARISGVRWFRVCSASVSRVSNAVSSMI